MDSRERTFLALNFEEPDRVPIDFWASHGFRGKLESSLNQSYGEFLDARNVDLRYIEGPQYVGPKLHRFPDGTEEDIWGVHRKRVALEINGAIETYKEVVESPLATAQTVEQIDDYRHWPSPEWFDYGVIESQCEEILKKKKVAVFMGDRLNRIAQLKPAMYLRGTEEIFLDMSSRPDLARAIFSRIRSFYCAYAERIFSAAKGKLDILLMGDDFGTQNGLLVSPGMWADLLGPGFAEYINLARNYNIRVMHHTCGSVREIIPLMIERGLDILQSLQPEAAGMEPRQLKAEFGNRIAFHGGISIQRTMPFGTTEDIHSEVKDRVEAFGRGGGYILCTAHNIQADTPIENVQELFAAYNEHGRYVQA